MKNSTKDHGLRGHFTPLRYPGGKGKLADFIKTLLLENDLADGDYVEPYAGGAGIAIELLLQEYVQKIHINDVSELVHSFWWSVLNCTDDLCRLIQDTPCTVDAWDRQKKILVNPSEYTPLEVGFSTFFLNRTNRSGILNGGVIGGRHQSGEWKIDARYNAPNLIKRIEAIANLKSRVELTRLDAIKFLENGAIFWPKNTLIYLDPPYYEKGRELYYDFYREEDHINVAKCVQTAISDQYWIVSYDNVDPICAMYKERRRCIYSIGYSARSSRKGSEAMFFCDQLKVPELIGPVTVSEQASYSTFDGDRKLDSDGPSAY